MTYLKRYAQGCCYTFVLSERLGLRSVLGGIPGNTTMKKMLKQETTRREALANTKWYQYKYYAVHRVQS